MNSNIYEKNTSKTTVSFNFFFYIYSKNEEEINSLIPNNLPSQSYSNASSDSQSLFPLHSSLPTKQPVNSSLYYQALPLASIEPILPTNFNTFTSVMYSSNNNIAESSFQTNQNVLPSYAPSSSDFLPNNPTVNLALNFPVSENTLLSSESFSLKPELKHFHPSKGIDISFIIIIFF
jgi:hypothetical protein